MIYECVKCGHTWERRSPKRGLRFCPKCGTKYWREPKPQEFDKICRQCGKSFKAKTPFNLFCSACFKYRRTKRVGARVATQYERGLVCPVCSEHKSEYAIRCKTCFTKEHPLLRHLNSIGNRVKMGDYVAIHLPDHPRARWGYVAEHILVWEQWHHKRLPKGWDVHHLNGIKNDNRPQNLLALPHAEHARYIQFLQTRIRELEQLHLPI